MELVKRRKQPEKCQIKSLPIPELVAAAKKTFSYKINHLFRIINPIRSIPLNRKSESLIILTNLHNNTPLDCSEEVIQLMLSFSGISRVSVLGLYQPWYSWLYELHHKQVHQVPPDIRKAIFINAMFKCAYQDQWLVLSDSKHRLSGRLRHKLPARHYKFL